MNNPVCKLLCAVLGLLATICVNAATLEEIGVADADAEVVPGQWHGGFEKCLRKAVDEHRKFIAVYGRAGCGHCDELGNALASSTFKNWLQDAGKEIVLCYLKSGDGGNVVAGDSVGYSWILEHSSGGFGVPRMVFYWEKPEGGVITEGVIGYGSFATPDTGAAYIIARAETAFAGEGGRSKVGNFFSVKREFDGVLKDGQTDAIKGVVKLKLSKMSKKSEVKLSGYLLGLDGKKKNLKAVRVKAEEWPVSFATTAPLWGALELDLLEGGVFKGTLGDNDYSLENASYVGGSISKTPMEFLATYLPNETAVSNSKAKWSVKSNGVFKGNLKILREVRGRNKKISVKVVGVVVDGVAAGTVTVKGEAPIAFEF